VPSYPSLRLWTDAARHLIARMPAGSLPVAEYTSKLRLDARHLPAMSFRRTSVPLRRIYVLERGRGPVRIERLSSRESYIELFKIAFRLNPLDRGAVHREMAALVALARRIPVARLRVPSTLTSLAAVHRAVRADLAACAPVRR